MEELLYLWREKIPISITRPFNYTGRGQTENFLIPKIVEAFKLKKQRLELGNLEVSRDFSDVRFIANAYLTLATQKSGFRILNICSGNLVSIREIVSVCTSLTGHRLEVVST
jgi:nucleoside-diphosphate-sugar epimerase